MFVNHHDKMCYAKLNMSAELCILYLSFCRNYSVCNCDRGVFLHDTCLAHTAFINVFILSGICSFICLL